MSTPYADADNLTAAATAPARPRAPMGAVLRSPAYLLLWSAQLLSMLAGFFNYVAVAWLVLQVTGSSLAMGSVLAAAAVPTALFMLLGGVASDRFSARNTMLVAGLIRGAVTGTVAALALTHSVRLWELFAAAVLVGTTSAFFVPASTSMVPRLLEDDQLEAGNGLLNLSRTAAMVLGSAAAGVVVAAAGSGTALAVDAGASMVGALLVLPLPGGAVLAAAGSALSDLRDGLLLAWRDVPLRVTLLVVALLNLFALGAIEVGLPALAHQRFGQGAAALGGAFAAWGLGSTVGSIGAGTRGAPARFGRVIIALSAVVGLGIAATGLAANLPTLLGVMAVMGVVEGAGTTYLFSWMQRRSDPSTQGRVMSLAMLASVGLEPLALAFAGALAARELALLFWVCAAGMEVTAALAALIPSVRRL